MKSLAKLVVFSFRYSKYLKHPLKGLAYLTATIVIFTLCWKAFEFGIANLNGVYVERKLNKWSEQGALDHMELARAEQSLQRALRLQADNAHYYALHAKLLEWKAFSDKKNAEGYLSAAITSLSISASYRPTWPNTWLDIALLDHKLSRYGENFQQSVNRAELLGGYKQDVTLGLVRLGFDTWNLGNAFMRAKLIAAIKRGLSIEDTAWKVLALAEDKSHIRIVCVIHRRLGTASALPADLVECR